LSAYVRSLGDDRPPANQGITELYSAGTPIDYRGGEQPLSQEKIVMVNNTRIQSLFVTPL
jgi:hypothetical protein